MLKVDDQFVSPAEKSRALSYPLFMYYLLGAAAPGTGNMGMNAPMSGSLSARGGGGGGGGMNDSQIGYGDVIMAEAPRPHTLPEQPNLIVD